MLEPFPWKNRGLADSKQLPKPGFSLSCSRIPEGSFDAALACTVLEEGDADRMLVGLVTTLPAYGHLPLERISPLGVRRPAPQSVSMGTADNPAPCHHPFGVGA